MNGIVNCESEVGEEEMEERARELEVARDVERVKKVREEQKVAREIQISEKRERDREDRERVKALKGELREIEGRIGRKTERGNVYTV